MTFPIGRQGQNTRLRIWREANFATRPDPVTSVHDLPFAVSGYGFGSTEEQGQSQKMPRGSNPMRPPRGYLRASGPLPLLAEEAVLGLLFERFFDQYVPRGATSQSITCANVEVGDNITLTVGGINTVFTAAAAESIPAREFKCEDDFSWTNAQTANSLKNVIDGHADFSAEGATFPPFITVIATPAPAAPITGTSSNGTRLAIVGVAPFHHMFKLLSAAPAAKSMGMEEWDAAASKGDQFDGVLVAGIEITARKEPSDFVVRFQLEGCGAVLLDEAAQVSETPELHAGQLFSLLNISALIDTVAALAVDEIQLSIRREITWKYPMDGLRRATYPLPGGCTIEGSITGVFDTTSLIRELADGESHSVLISLPLIGDDDKKLIFKLDEVDAFRQSAPTIDGPGERQVTVQIAPHHTSGADGSAFSVQLLNGVETYVDW